MIDHYSPIPRIFSPEALLPSQMPRSSAVSPEKRLMLAVLDKIVHDIQAYRVINTYCARRLYQEAREDVASEAVFPFSFVFCCQHLGLEPERLRRKLLSEDHVSRSNLNGAQSPRTTRHHQRRTAKEVHALRQKIDALRLAGFRPFQIAARLGESQYLVDYYMHTLAHHRERRRNQR